MRINDLYKAVTPLSVCEEFDIETRQKSNRYWIRCPAHKRVLGKEDRNISNCVLTKRGFHCWACGTTGDIFDMVGYYLDMPMENFADKLKVAELIAERMAPEYLGDNEPSKRDELPQLPFNKSDLAKIGLRDVRSFTPEWPTSEHPTSITKQKDGMWEYGSDQERYYQVTPVSYSLRAFYNEDAEGFLTMVIQKAYEAYHKSKDLLSGHMDLSEFPKDSQDMIFRLLSERMKAAERILKRVGIEEEHTVFRAPLDFSDVKI